jgi:hypothetical protein
LRVTYQTPVNIILSNKEVEVLSATFEASLVYANYSAIIKLYDDDAKLDSKDRVFKDSDFIAKVAAAFHKSSADDVCNEIYSTVRNKSNDKVSFALDLIYWLEKAEAPLYIKEGLAWLQSKLQRVESKGITGGEQ